MDNPGPRLISTDEGYSAEYRGRLLYSRKSPVTRARGIADRARLLPKSLVVIPSPVLFHGISSLYGRICPDSHILCIELDEALMAFSLPFTPQDLFNDGRVSYVRSSDPVQITSFAENLGLERFRRIEMVPLSGGYPLFREEYDSICRSLERSIRQFWQNRMTLLHMSRLWIGNMIKNLSRHWFHLGGSLPSVNRPIVVAGAGESLEHSLPLLRDQREHFLLLAVDTALPTLAASGIEPDIILILESQAVNAMDFAGHQNRSFYCISDVTSHPSVLENISCFNHFILSRFADITLLSRLYDAAIHLPTLPALGSVGVAAVEIAFRLTDAPVLLTGLDFSYAAGKPHARGSPSHLLSLATSGREKPVGWYGHAMGRPMVRVPDIHGNKITTDVVLHSYGENLSEILKNRNRAYDLRKTGLPLSAVRLENHEISHLLAGFGGARSEAPGWSPPSKTRNGREEKTVVLNRIEGFFSREIAGIDRVVDIVRSSPTNHTGETEREELLKGLLETNYVFIGFPDADEWERLEKSFLARYLASAGEYRRRFLRGLAVLKYSRRS